MASVNDGHRQRLRARMMNDGLSGFADHEVLELLLFQYLPRKDTNKLAHKLLDQFGSFAGVLDASPRELMLVEGISEVTACNIAMLKEVFQRYKKSQAEKISLNSISAIIKYTQKLIADSYIEKLVVVYVDASTNFLYKEQFTSGNVDTVTVNIKDIVATAMRVKASGVVLFHCHVSGTVLPSVEDYAFTEKVMLALGSLDVILLEHIIYNDHEQFYSMLEHGEIAQMREKFKKLT